MIIYNILTVVTFSSKCQDIVLILLMALFISRIWTSVHFQSTWTSPICLLKHNFFYNFNTYFFHICFCFLFQVKMLSYVLLFSVNFSDRDPLVWRSVERVQVKIIYLQKKISRNRSPMTSDRSALVICDVIFGQPISESLKFVWFFNHTLEVFFVCCLIGC